LESASSIATGNRINGAVQWVRGRFNEVLEKAEFVRLKLLDAQKQLPEDHPAHPNNHTSASRLAGGTSASADGVILSTGVTAEKLMYDRALEMSRSAAINEIANVDLPGCELSYVTAIRMLEAVLENDDIGLQKKANIVKEEKENQLDDASVNGINLDDRQAVQKGL
jgi:serine/threonine-protein kinase ULK2